ncbi:chromosome condensation membrane protein [Serratia fonticola]|uniref:Chromosome condensation membrane protein n=1 Tax=Serratia fonticola TaxID=47917 RepID=A0A4U9TTR3_SERFO|nr:chromosome condensation membrane protein [Serratia fonticola]
MWSSLLAVFIGGGLGSVLRWAVSLKLNPLHPHIPLGTLTVNLVGVYHRAGTGAVYPYDTH